MFSIHFLQSLGYLALEQDMAARLCPEPFGRFSPLGFMVSVFDVFISVGTVPNDLLVCLCHSSGEVSLIHSVKQKKP